MTTAAHHKTQNGHSAHNLLGLWLEQRYCDLTLQFVTTEGQALCQLKTHKSVLHASQVPYFQTLIDEKRAQVTVRVTADTKASHLRTLFHLLYLPSLEAATLGPLATKLDKEWLQYYQLSLFVTYDAFSHYLLQRLARGLCESVAVPLLQYCDETGNYGPLYKLLTQWLQYCHHSLALSTPIQAKQLLPPKLLSPQRIVYYRAICDHCLRAEHTQAFGHWAVDLGGLQCGEASCDFAIWRSPKALSLMMRLNHQRAEDDMSVEEGTLLAHTRLSSFSRVYDAPALQTRRSLTPHLYGELAQFQLDREACYEGQCDLCQRARQPIYVLHAEIELNKEPVS